MTTFVAGFEYYIIIYEEQEEFSDYELQQSPSFKNEASPFFEQQLKILHLTG
jgi:hypothetical protein